MQVDGVVLAERKDFQLHVLADEVGETDERGLAVPKIVFDKDAVCIDAGCVALIRYLQIEIEVLVQFVEADDGSCGCFLPITLCGHRECRGHHCRPRAGDGEDVTLKAIVYIK